VGVKDFFPNFPNFTEKFLCDFCLVYKISNRVDVTCKTGLHAYFCKRLGAIFARIFRDFAWIFVKSKLLRERLHPRLLHHWFSLWSQSRVRLHVGEGSSGMLQAKIALF